MLIQDKMEIYPFSNSERIIVDYLLKEKQNIENKTTSQIAEETFSSKSTLVRIAHKLNFDGWTALKKELLAEIDYLEKNVSNLNANYPFSNKDSIMSIAGKIATLEKEAIDDTLSMLNHDDLRKALHLLSRARKINIFAVSNNLLIVQEFKHQMSRIKKEVHVHALQDEILFNAYLADEDSCAMIISYSGETGVLIEAANILKEKNISIVAITSIGSNSLSKMGDSVLRITTREKLYSKISTYSTDASIVYLLNVLYSCIFAMDYENNVRLKKMASKRIETARSSDSSILKE